MSYQVRAFDLSGIQGLSKKAIDLHLGLYKTYVEQLNKLLEQSPLASPNPAPLALDGYNRRFAFEYNGVRLHELFFEQLAGKRGTPNSDSDFVEALNEGHGGFSGWKSAVESLAKTRGVGWVLALREHDQPRVHTCWVDLHQLNLPANAEVVFALDLWEHAFMVDFAPSQRADYVKIVFENIDWSVIEARFAAVGQREHA